MYTFLNILFNLIKCNYNEIIYNCNLMHKNVVKIFSNKKHLLKLFFVFLVLVSCLFVILNIWLCFVYFERNVCSNNKKNLRETYNLSEINISSY